MIFSNGRKFILVMSTAALIPAALLGCNKGVSATDIRNEYMREEALKQGANYATDGFQNAADNARNAAGDFADRTRQTAGELSDMAGNKAQDARVAADEFSDGARTAAGDVAGATKDLASDAAESAKDMARNQAEDTKEDARFFSKSIYDEWQGILRTLTTPWGIGQGLDDNEYRNETYDDSTLEYGESRNGSGTMTASAADSSVRFTTDAGTGRNADSSLDKEANIKETSFDFSSIGEYAGSACIAVNGNTPFFDAEDYTVRSFEYYSPLDSLGRCGYAYANICKDLMPESDRGEIGMVKPSGWHQNKYPGIIPEDPPYLYNRCHLIAFSLAGENANKKNLITGTRYFNVETGMEGYELQVLSYVRRTGNHVLYRVTPYFKGDNLVATGVLMEARSVEDDGISFCAFVYNIQPGIAIDYRTGENWAV